MALYSKIQASIIFAFFCSSQVFAAQVRMVDGKNITGRIVKNTGKYVTVENGDCYQVRLDREWVKGVVQDPVNDAAPSGCASTDGKRAYRSRRNDVVFRYPADWFVAEFPEERKTFLLVTREEIDVPTDDFKMGFWFVKYDDFPAGGEEMKNDPVSWLSGWAQQSYLQLEFKKKELIKREETRLYGFAAVKQELAVTDDRGQRQHVWQVSAVNGSAFIDLAFWSPESECGSSGKEFEWILASLQLSFR
jgi:hypothetical protein